MLIVLGPAVLGGLLLLLNRTRWGILVRAATEDREMVAALGVNQKWLFTSVFFVGAFLAGLGGALQLPREPANLMMDFNIIAEAFVVVVVGGMGSIGGAFLAAVLIAELQGFRHPRLPGDHAGASVPGDGGGAGGPALGADGAARERRRRGVARGQVRAPAGGRARSAGRSRRWWRSSRSCRWSPATTRFRS